MTDEYLTKLKRFEGLRLSPYRDQLGLPTIGYGHRIPSMDQPPITEAMADLLLQDDVRNAALAAKALCPNLTGRRLDALTDLVFNGGKGALDGKDPLDPEDDAGIVKALRAEQWEDAAHRFEQYCHGHLPDGTVMVVDALERRRKMLSPWIRFG